MNDLKLSQEDFIDFELSQDAIFRFGKFTGDFSSLHHDSEFGRKSMFRSNIAHGMLPLIFLPCLNNCCVSGYASELIQLNLDFKKPAFPGERLRLQTRITQEPDEEGTAKLECKVFKPETHAEISSGFLTLRFRSAPPDSPVMSGTFDENQQWSLVSEGIEEQNFGFEEIPKGLSKSIHFSIPENTDRVLAWLISGNDSKSKTLKLLKNAGNFSLGSLFSTFMFSTLVGMCLPGRKGAFLNLSVDFPKPAEPSRPYTLTGVVDYKSESASTLLISLSIASEKEKNLFVSGKLMAKVNPPPPQMPSIQDLKDRAGDLGLKNKVVLITGSSRGVGETTAKLLSLYGASVIVNYHRGKGDAERVVNEIRNNGGKAISIGANVSDPEQVTAMINDAVAAFSRIDVLVNNAVGNAHSIPFLELAWDDVQEDIDIVLKGAFNCCQAVLPFMVKQGGGKIINLSTIYNEVPLAGQGKYIMAKSGLVGLTRLLACEYASKNIQINTVVPSFVETDLSQSVPKFIVDSIKNETPMKRNAFPEEVAQSILFLASSLSNFTTGQKIMVTGGNPPFL